MRTVLETKNWTTATSADGRGAYKYSCRSNYSQHRTASCSKQNAIKIISVQLSLGVAPHDVCTLQTWYTQKTGTWLSRTLALHRIQKRKTSFMMYFTNSVLRNVKSVEISQQSQTCGDMSVPVCRFGMNRESRNVRAVYRWHQNSFPCLTRIHVTRLSPRRISLTKSGLTKMRTDVTYYRTSPSNQFISQ
jgi:hypothetical protein